MKQRHTLAVVAAAAAGVLALAGCGAAAAPDSSSPSTGDPNQTLEFWLWHDNPDDTTWKDLAAEFNAQSTNGTVNITEIPFAQYQDKLLSAIASGTGPDAGRFKDIWLGEFVEADAVAPLSDRIDGWDGADDVVPVLWDTGKVPGDDTVYLMPHQYTTLYMYYNKAIFEANGLDAPETHEDVMDAAATLAAAGQYAMDIRGGWGGQDQWAAWMFSGGAEFVDDDGELILTDGSALQPYQDYMTLYQEGATPPGSINVDFPTTRSNFISGVTAMMINHPASLSAVREGLGDDLGVIPMPSVDPDARGTVGTMSGTVIFSSSEKQDLAWEWLTFLNSHDAMLKMSTSTEAQLPVLQSVIDDPTYANDEDKLIAVDAIQYATTWPLFPGTATLVNKDWVPIMQSAFEGQITSEQALEQIQDVMAR